MVIDLRSDTVTEPTDAMRAAMAAAPVGDDVYQEDKTLQRLEARGAEILGKEAGLFVPSGTMVNLIAVLAVCERGDEIIMESQMHMFWYEVAGIAALAGVQIHPIPGVNGTPAAADLRQAIRARDIHFPVSRMFCLENSHNRGGGTCVSKEDMDKLSAIAREAGLWVHVDGARIFNAATALNVEPDALVAGADSVMFCLSKGLAAPVGSLLVGPAEFIEKARRARKMVGGGMRQAGVLAAAGLIAFDEMRLRLDEDQQTAAQLARGLAELGAEIDMDTVQTNIVRFNISGSAETFVAALKERGVLANATGERSVRMVTHYQISSDQIDTVLNNTRELL
ncbi:MAG: low-specificity L-threonine aldolase [Firmicutes bacterium]|nr:low-specificity L-threonine aldolase [Bacillota bacterium]